ncbi:hypothetical protein PENFLA_c090G05285 [Penicillium flavigenum]|uniref:Uncharacterized protein n=1 Tax=Penicillium flavigenum TaxID=254877 RepID=A0A1V6S7U9_9EURO|nr:hypothetical protein PENFLA_c090G05285 [Penicillium flavigenum]
MTTTAAINFITEGFPAPGLRPTQRLITGNKEEDGKGHFLVTDNGDHHRVMGENQAVANIIYSTNENPVDLNDDKDIKYAQENEPGLHITNGTVVRMIDFGPGVESPMHRAMSIDYGIVLEGEFELTLDSGETRIMKRGDSGHATQELIEAAETIAGILTTDKSILWERRIVLGKFEPAGYKTQESSFIECLFYPTLDSLSGLKWTVPDPLSNSTRASDIFLYMSVLLFPKEVH